MDKNVVCMVFLVMTISSSMSARILYQVPPLDAAPPATTDSPRPAVAASPPLATSGTASASSATADHPLTFFMHDILGGTTPSARVVTGVVANTAVSGQIPFAKPNSAVLPVNNGIPVNCGNDGVINNSNVPLLTDLGGTNSAVYGNGAGNGGANGLPFFTGGDLPAGAALQKLQFGTMTVIDDELTEGKELGSAMVGKAQGFYVASSEDGNSQTMAFTALFKDGEYADSLSFFGVHRTADSESHVAVVGGTGKYVKAKGFATLQTLPPVDHHATDGMEMLVQFKVYLG